MMVGGVVASRFLVSLLSSMRKLVKSAGLDMAGSSGIRDLYFWFTSETS